MKVAEAAVHRGLLIYATIVGSEDAIASVIIAPDAEQVKISIWPGKLRMTCPTTKTSVSGARCATTNTKRSFDSTVSAHFSIMPSTWSKIFVMKRFSTFKMPPLGPGLYCFITFAALPTMPMVRVSTSNYLVLLRSLL